MFQRLYYNSIREAIEDIGDRQTLGFINSWAHIERACQLRQAHAGLVRVFNLLCPPQASERRIIK